MVEGSLDKLGREAMAKGHYIIEVETKEPAPKLLDILRKISGIIKVEARGDVLLVTANSDLRSEIAKIIVQNNAPLIQMNIQKFSLDEIYMKYFHEG